MARSSLIAGSLALVALLLAMPLEVCADDTAAAAPVRRFVRVPAPDGIQIRRYNKTNGKSPDDKDRVVVHYHGTLEDGSVFDSSLKSGHPAVFSLKKVVPCWKEALKLMHVGEEARLTCPPDTAYGPKGSPPVIPPNETLTFEIELVGIQ